MIAFPTTLGFLVVIAASQGIELRVFEQVLGLNRNYT